MNIKRAFPFPLLLLALVLLVLVACGPAEGPQDGQPATVPVTIIASPESSQATSEDVAAYPGPEDTTSAAVASGYPGVEDAGNEIFSEPPSPEYTVPEASAESGAVGGILIRELTESGYVPFDPHELILAEVIRSDDGRGLLAYGDESLRAETFPTGIFLFKNVPPGEYGLIVNLAIAEFPVRDQSGNEVLIEVAAGEAIDLGQIVIQMP